jgi:hypothetical protein
VGGLDLVVEFAAGDVGLEGGEGLVEVVALEVGHGGLGVFPDVLEGRVVGGVGGGEGEEGDFLERAAGGQLFPQPKSTDSRLPSDPNRAR